MNHKATYYTATFQSTLILLTLSILAITSIIFKDSVRTKQ